MTKTKICIIGAGNISNTRHIPALKTIEDAVIEGVLSNKIERARQTAARHSIKNFAEIDIDAPDGGLSNTKWFKDVDAVVIGAPPHAHYPLVKMALEANKHVLVEKPMMMNEAECDELMALAKKKKKLLYVMHNFQYARNMLKLNEIIESRKYGEIENITEVQFTNHDRRLPEWYNDLPMGLFYDEAAHFVYLLDRHAGKIKVNNSYAVYNKDKSEMTPASLTVNATAGDTPVVMMLNFHAPVCEWYYMVSFKKRILIYDFFKDILISLPTDGEHLAGDILRNSLAYTWQYWSQFIANGVRMLGGKLLYGHEIVLRKFVGAINGDPIDDNLTAESGRKNVVIINSIIDKANKR